MRRTVWLTVFVTVLTLLLLAGPVFAQDGDASNAKTRTLLEQFIWPGGGIIGILILLMDVASVALIVEHFISIRRLNILPDPVREQLRAMIEEKQYREVIEVTAAEPSFLSYVVHAALGEASHGYGAMERAMEEATEERTTKLLRKIEPLNVIGNIAPMMGLLGTVLGMIMAFNDIVAAGGVPDAGSLADSIGVALVTTFWGLVVAVPALTVFAIMRNRIDGLAAECALTAQEMIGVFRPAAKK